MSLLEDTANQEPTQEEKLARATRRVKQSSSQLFQNMINTFNQTSQIIWANSQGLTPQEIFDELGTDGGELLQLSELLVTTVNTALPGTLPTEKPYDIAVDAEGNVTVTPKPETTPEA